MRHRARFQSELSVQNISYWLRRELIDVGYQPVDSVTETRYAFEFDLLHEGEKVSLSLFHDPAVESSVWLYIKPKLKFFDAIRGKADTLREALTTHCHNILSNTQQVHNLGWYTERRIASNPPQKAP